MSKAPASIETLSFEAALSELDKIVKTMETGETALEDSIAAYERGIALKDHCEKKLREAKSKIEKISIDQNGAAKTEPFGEQE